ncbi:MAG: phytoene/squalene synthase family protein [Pseudomonadota bacterium]
MTVSDLVTLPPASDVANASADDLRACRELLRGGSRSFYAASFLLPSSIAQPACSLYAFCRVADDAVDIGDSAAGLAEITDRLQRIYAGDPADHPADRAFTDVARTRQIPMALPEALLEGFAWDVEGREYDDLSDLMGYAARVAGAVGAMMTLVMGRREAAVLARACDLGAAMQLTNICRDVGEDARNGRLYLPRTWMVEAGIDPEEFLKDPVYTPALGEVVTRLLRAAERLYRRASTGIGKLPLLCRPGIHAARLIYAEIGRQLERDGLDSVGHRAVVSWRRKLALVERAMAATVHPAPTRLNAPALNETHFLVAAVHPSQPEVAARTTYGQLLADIDADTRGFAWMIDLFSRLERRERGLGPAPAASEPGFSAQPQPPT